MKAGALIGGMTILEAGHSYPVRAVYHHRKFNPSQDYPRVQIGTVWVEIGKSAKSSSTAIYDVMADVIIRT